MSCSCQCACNHSTVRVLSQLCQAMYRALARSPENPYVQKALSTGLENVRMLSSQTPNAVKIALCTMHNMYHDGAGDTWITLLDRAADLMQSWDERINGPNGTGLTTRNSQYDMFLDQFVFREKAATGWNGSLNLDQS